MVAAADVGERVAKLLVQDRPGGPKIQELLGAGDYSMTEATAIMGEAARLQPVRYVQVAPAEARAGMLAAGLSASFADAILETAASFNRGDRWGQGLRTAETSSPTTLQAWSRQALGGKP